LIEDGAIVRARLALGGVGTMPWRALEAEEILRGASATGLTFWAAAQAALDDPFTVAGTAFKVELAKRTIIRILHTVSGVRP
jgi:xanthine dehydrogenase YagS FAD-binding subunit